MNYFGIDGFDFGNDDFGSFFYSLQSFAILKTRIDNRLQHANLEIENRPRQINRMLLQYLVKNTLVKSLNSIKSFNDHYDLPFKTELGVLVSSNFPALSKIY